MEIEESLFAYLTGFLSCAVYPASRPQGSSTPVVTYARKTGGYMSDLAGAISFTKPLFEITVYSADISETITLADTIREQMQGFHGTLSTREIYFISLQDESDSYFTPVDSSETGLFTTTQTYQVIYKEN